VNAILRAQTSVILIAACTVAACTGTSRTTPETSQYKEVLLADVVKAPHDFDGSFVRVRGLSELHYEGTVIFIPPQKRGHDPDDSHWIWLQVGWPLDARLMAMNRQEVTVDARFVADLNGDLGGVGTLTDIRAIWLPGRESEAFVLNHETRTDALEQLRFQTGWIMLGTHIRNGHRRGNLKDNGWMQAWFSFSSPPTPPDDNRAPKNGDQIEITERTRIYLLDYATKGEEQRLEPPIQLSQSNSTRLWLAPSARVELADVRANWANDFAVVVARVVPVASR
jgi:hypothetical protein